MGCSRIILFCLLFVSISGFSQYSINSFNVNFIPEVNPSAPLDTVIKVELKLGLLDSIGVANIHVKVGTASHAADVFNQAFAFNVSSNLPANTSYKRQGKTIWIELKSFPVTSDFYYEVQVEGSNGAFSSPRTYHFN